MTPAPGGYGALDQIGTQPNINAYNLNGATQPMIGGNGPQAPYGI